MSRMQENQKLDGLHATIRFLIEQELAANEVSYNKNEPYQTYERIKFEGLRWSVEKRIAEYGLGRFFDADAAVLDIGSNFGFFVCEFAMHCRLVHGIEPTPHLIKIGEATANYLGVGNKVQFFDVLFEDFVPPTTYDVVLSLAAFYTQDGRERSTASAYFGRISKLLAPGGQIFYESTSYTKQDSDPHFAAKSAAVEAMEAHFGSIETWETPSGSEGYFRGFAIGRKE